jgi:UPF0716 family protein affecting phage T7 exclusion
MAEIRVERVRKRSLGWLWALLLVLVLAVVGWYLWSTGHLGASSTSPAADSTRTSLETGRAATTALRDAIPSTARTG